MMFVWAGIAFFIASIPFSVLIGRWVFRKDIRQFGDKNPGSTNVLRASGNKIWFFIAVNLDICKGLIPVALAYWYGGIGKPDIAVVALMAIVGHAFSPFLRFQGGKAIATTAGVWMALTYFESIFVQSILLVFWFMVLDSSDWSVIFASSSWLVYLLVFHPDPTLLIVWLGSMIILVYKHRAGLRHLPQLRILNR